MSSPARTARVTVQPGTGLCIGLDGETRRSHPTPGGAQYEIHRIIANGSREGRSRHNRRGLGYVQVTARKCGLCSGFHVVGGRRRGNTRGQRTWAPRYGDSTV